MDGYNPYPARRTMAMSVVSRSVARTVQVTDMDTSHEQSPPRVRDVPMLRLGASDPIDGMAQRSPSRAHSAPLPDDLRLVRAVDIEAAELRMASAEATAGQAM